LADTVTLDEWSQAAPALASWRGRLHLAWAGSNGAVNRMSAGDDLVFGDKETLPFGSRHQFRNQEAKNVPPALAATPAALHLAWRDTDNRLGMLAWSSSGESARLPVDQMVIPCTIALTAAGDDPALVWRDQAGLQLARLRDGQVGTPARFPDRRWITMRLQIALGFPEVLPVRARNAVAVTPTVEGTMLAWTTWEGRIVLVPEAGGRFGARRVLKVRAKSAPALCMYRGDLVVAWVGRRRRLRLMRPDRDSRPVRLPARSSEAPALCVHGNDIVLAWARRHPVRSRLCVARLVPDDLPATS
jgi:hypothetical protein